ncbi:MAG: CopD family protein [Bacteroidia bacterium]
MNLLYIKALHIVFVVTWFAGLFYIWRLFVNYVEAGERTEPAKTILQDQFLIMMKRLYYGITWPSAILASFFGFYMMFGMYGWLWVKQPWLHIKLSFVLLLWIYHVYGQRILTQITEGTCTKSSTFFRLMNELASVFLIAIIFVVVLKDTLSWIWGLVGLAIVIAVLLVAIKAYKKMREKGRGVNG